MNFGFGFGFGGFFFLKKKEFIEKAKTASYRLALKGLIPGMTSGV